MLFPVLLVALVVALASGSSFLRAEKGVTNYEGPITLGHHTYPSRKEFILSGKRCATKSLTEAEKFEVDQKLATVSRHAEENARTMATINVHFHVITNTAQEGNIPAPLIQGQIDALNAAFAQVNVNFVLQGTTVTENDAWFHADPGSDEEIAMKAALRVGTAETMNVYTSMNSVGNLGWATLPNYYDSYPSYDGIVIDPNTVPGGSFAPFNEGITLVHEVGHWMGLYHTFDGGCQKFARQGDGVKDTPAVKEPNFGCPTSVNSCPGMYYQFKGKDLVHNYMDYGDDACLSEFTLGQKQRMRQSWLAYRLGK